MTGARVRRGRHRPAGRLRRRRPRRPRTRPGRRVIAEDPRWRGDATTCSAAGMAAVGAELHDAGRRGRADAGRPGGPAGRRRLGRRSARGRRPSRRLEPSRTDRRRSRAVDRCERAPTLAAVTGATGATGRRRTRRAACAGPRRSPRPRACWPSPVSASTTWPVRPADRPTRRPPPPAQRRTPRRDGAPPAGRRPRRAATRSCETGTDYTAGRPPRRPRPSTPRCAPPARAPRPRRGRRRRRRRAAASAAGRAGAAELGRLRAPDALQACLDAIAQANAGGPITVETVDYARFDGAPGRWWCASPPPDGTLGLGGRPGLRHARARRRQHRSGTGTLSGTAFRHLVTSATGAACRGEWRVPTMTF